MRKPTDKEIRIETNWEYTQQINPAFEQLMSMLLQPHENMDKNGILTISSPWRIFIVKDGG